MRGSRGNSWGKGIVDNLADDLRKEFPGANGFSAANLWRMKNFYEAYCRDEKIAQLVREIGWSHNISILEKCKSEQEREFYIRSCRKHGWSNTHSPFPENRQSRDADSGSAGRQSQLSSTILASPLDLEDAHSERELERALTGRVEAFLQEMGNMLTFVGSQYKIQVGSESSSSISSSTIAG